MGLRGLSRAGAPPFDPRLLRLRPRLADPLSLAGFGPRDCQPARLALLIVAKSGRRRRSRLVGHLHRPAPSPHADRAARPTPRSSIRRNPSRAGLEQTARDADKPFVSLAYVI